MITIRPRVLALSVVLSLHQEFYADTAQGTARNFCRL